MKLDSETIVILAGVLKALMPRLEKMAEKTKSPIDDYLVHTLSWYVNAMKIDTDTKV